MHRSVECIQRAHPMHQAVAERLQQLCHTAAFRPYTNTDVIGCELGGPLKNVIAISAGMAQGLSVGENTRAMVITRGLVELMAGKKVAP